MRRTSRRPREEPLDQAARGIALVALLAVQTERAATDHPPDRVSGIAPAAGGGSGTLVPAPGDALQAARAYAEAARSPLPGERRPLRGAVIIEHTFEQIAQMCRQRRGECAVER